MVDLIAAGDRGRGRAPIRVVLQPTLRIYKTAMFLA
jgi:hypothetical protein